MLIADFQSRSDFLYCRNELYLFHAPIDREHIGIVYVDTENIATIRVLIVEPGKAPYAASTAVIVS